MSRELRRTLRNKDTVKLQRGHTTASAEDRASALPAPVPTDAHSAALIALRATTAAGNPLSGRQLETRFGLSRADVTKVRQLVAVESNGHNPEEN